jgi:hypothetical protein
LYLPVTHLEHVNPLGPDQPEVQVQLAETVLCAGEIEPAPQAAHDASADPPVSTRYLPAPQAVHDASADPPVSTPYLPAPQAVHDASAVCPVEIPYLPSPQAMQSPLPASDLYLPATHCVQLPPAAPDDPV